MTKKPNAGVIQAIGKRVAVAEARVGKLEQVQAVEKTKGRQEARTACRIKRMEGAVRSYRLQQLERDGETIYAFLEPIELAANGIAEYLLDKIEGRNRALLGMMLGGTHSARALYHLNRAIRQLHRALEQRWEDARDGNR